MGKIITIDDIEREKAKEEREKFTTDISEDINKVFDNVFKPNKPKPKKKKISFWTFLKWIGILFLLLFIINFILGNIYIFIKLIHSLFGIE